MRTVFALVRPDAGSVRWKGAPIGDEQRVRFGYMPEQRGLYPRMKITDQLVYFGRLHGMAKGAATDAATAWLDRLGLADRTASRLEELSHGNQQRVQLAAALLHDPEVLVLDEPFSGLDPIGVEDMTAILSERAAAGVAVVFSSHQLDLVEDLCDDVVIINRGAIVLDGAVREIRNRSPRRYLDVEIPGAGGRWADDVEGATVIRRDGDRVRLLVSDGTHLGDVVGLAELAGTVSHFSYEPPNLSEVFREAVAK